MLYWSTRATKTDKKSLVPAQYAQRTIQARSPFFLLFESPLTSVTTVSSGHPSLVYLLDTILLNLSPLPSKLGRQPVF
jgi:hypothetical protein